MKTTIEMAREADVYCTTRQPTLDAMLERFAALIRAEEREACAKACDEVGQHPSLTPRHCAEGIRARDCAVRNGPAYPAGECDCGAMSDRQRLEAIVSVINKYLPPDGIPINDAMSEIISYVDPLPPLPVQERNFCPRCGKRTADLTTIHTCTPPQEKDV